MLKMFSSLPEILVFLMAIVGLLAARSGIKKTDPKWEVAATDCAERTGLPTWQINVIYLVIIAVAGLLLKFVGALAVLSILP